MDETKKTVVITDLRSEEAKSAAVYLRENGYEVVTVPEDILLYHEEDLQAFADSVKDSLTGVIHPAPPMIKGGILDVTEEEWERASNEGAIAALIVTKVFCGIFREKKAGSLIFLNSIHAEKPVGKGILFSMNCGAADMLSREAVQDYASDGINIYFVERGILSHDDGKSDVTALYCGVDLRYPRREIPETGYLNGLLAFLLTDAAYPLTGSPIRADAGMTGFYNQHRNKVEGREYNVRK